MKTKIMPILLIATILISAFLFAGCKPQICPYTQKAIAPGKRNAYFSELKEWKENGTLPFDDSVLKTIAEIASSLQYEDKDMRWSADQNEEGCYYVFFEDDNIGCCVYLNAVGDIWKIYTFNRIISEYITVYESEDYQSPTYEMIPLTPIGINPADPRTVAGKINPEKAEEYLEYLKEREEFNFTDEALTIIAETMSSLPIEDLDRIDVKQDYVNTDAEWAIIMCDSNGTRYQISVDDKGTILFVYVVYDGKDVKELYSYYIY